MNDLHSHLLPALDDGSPTLDESIHMLETWVKLGYTKIITTPHVINASYPNTRERILGQMYNLQDIIEQRNIPILLEASAEYRIEPELLMKLEKDELIPFGNQNYLLVEMPWEKPEYDTYTIINQLIASGYQLILAHPERHSYLSGSLAEFDRLKEAGILFQLNLLSLTGKYGRQALKTAKKLIKQQKIDFTGTDAHDNNDLIQISTLKKNTHFKTLQNSKMIRNEEL